MNIQNYQRKDSEIDAAFEKLKKTSPDRLKQPINLSWSNWGFGQETLKQTANRLAGNGIEYIELHGNHYGPDLGYDPGETKKILGDNGIRTAGICGMFSADNDLASNRGFQRQAAIDYLKREIEFTNEMGGTYILVVPAAVGRPAAYDDAEWERSIDSLLRVADLFVQAGIEAAIEPIRSAEVSIVHTVADAKRYISEVGHPGVGHINADLYHMFTEEDHIPSALTDAGEQLANLHVADSNRRALGLGFLDLDRVIKALYLIGFNRPGRYFTPEPLGPGGDPYPAMHGKHDPAVLDEMVRQTATYFREREREVVTAS
jgi:sugar phosphate isomerase/epimerase